MTKIVTLPQTINEGLRQFVPLEYQWPVIDAIEKDNIKNLMLIWNRRGGKDITALAVTVRQALLRRGSYLYMLPQQKQARQVIFDGMTYEGKPLLSYIPPGIITKKLQQEMKLTLINGSNIYVCGSNFYENYRGISPMGLVMSEAAYSHPQAYPTFVPALERNDAFTLLISTPNGHNWFHDLYKRAKLSKKWFVQLLTINDTKTATPKEVEELIKENKISWDMAQSEYYCRFDVGVEGSYYARYIQKAREEERIGTILYDSKYPVHTAWDLGWNDCTDIIFFQIVNKNIHVIDFYENHHKDMDHYIKYVKEKNYIYGTHILPHDIEQNAQITGTTRLEKFQDHNMNYVVLARTSELDGIDALRCIFGKIFFDEKKCEHLIKCLDNFRKEYDQKRKSYYDKPVRDWSKHASDAMRYLAMGWRDLLGGDKAAYEKYNEAWNRKKNQGNRALYRR